MSFFLALVTTFFIADALWWFSAWRRARVPWLRLLVSLFALMQITGLALVLGARALDIGSALKIPRFLVSATFIWHLLVVLPWFIIFVCSQFVAGIRRLVIRRRPPLESHIGMTRREWLRAGVTMAPAILSAGGALFAERQLEQFRLRRMAVPVPNLPPALDGLTVAHVTDIHVGHFTHGRVLEEIVRATNDLQADLVLMTGDLINMAMRDLPAGIDLMRGLRGRQGVFLCEGNHDLFEDPAGFRREVRRAGLQFLREEAAAVEIANTRVQLLGAAWTHSDVGHRATMERLGELRDSNAFPIVLAHHPHAFDFAEGFPLMLAGHTHGGQLMLSDQVGFGPWMFRYWSGQYRRPGRSLVVSNGTGNWFPVRTHAPAEIIQLTLRLAQAS
jgi:predicted MPP superfamily phosphohydrolase